MKTLIKFSAALMLVLMAPALKAQTYICPGSTSVITAPNPLGLSSPTYSLNPGGITSPGPSFTIASVAGTYTLYTTGTDNTSAIVTSTYVTTVVFNAPDIFVSSANNFTLGCGLNGVGAIDISGNTSPIPGGSINYTLLPPGSSTVLPANLGSMSHYTMNIPGDWTAVIRDNLSQCTAWDTIHIIANTTPPAMPAVTISQNTLTCSSPSATLQATPGANLSFYWMLPSGVTNNSVVISANNSAPMQSVVITPTLQVMDISNGCTTSSVMPTIYQNIYKPNAAIAGPTPGSACTPTVMLSNISTTGIPPGTFPTSSPVAALLWEGPYPQPTLGLSSNYVAQTSGTYSMIAMDNNNGCTALAMINVNIGTGVAAFSHTISNGIAAFENISTGTNVATAYYWDFGDGYISTQPDPWHTYTSGGAYLVKLRISEPGSICVDSVVQSVNVSGIPCVANSGFSMVPTATAQLWNIVPASPWNVSAATWSWGDGSTSNTLYASHQYSAAGLYNICLSVTVSCAGTSSTCTSYSVYRVSEETMITEVHVIAPELVTAIASPEAGTQPSWSIVPNPNTGDFKLNLDGNISSVTHLSICDLTGRMVQEQVIEPNSTFVPVQAKQLPAGMYFVSLSSDNTKVTKRMVIVH